MKKKILTITLFLIFIINIGSISYAIKHNEMGKPQCTTELILVESGNPTCSSLGYKKYSCNRCQMHITEEWGPRKNCDWGNNHKCVKCGRNFNSGNSINGLSYATHRFIYDDVDDILYCSVCGAKLDVVSESGTESMNEYIAIPYGKVAPSPQKITITLNYPPYNRYGKLMAVQGIFSQYMRHTAEYHWGNDTAKYEYSVYEWNPQMIDYTGKTVSITATGSKKEYTIKNVQDIGSGDYVFTILIGGNWVGQPHTRLCVGGGSASLEPKTYTLTVNYIDAKTNQNLNKRTDEKLFS